VKSPLHNFDIKSSYWKIDPQLKAIEPFATLYKNDKSKGKSNSSLLMWAIALFTDPESRLSKLSKARKQEIIQKDYYKGLLNWDKYKEHIDIYKSLYTSQAVRSLVNWEEKLQERDAFLKEVPYSLDTGETLDKMLANTSKLYDLYEKILEKLKEEESEGVTKGGRTESLGEKKLL